MYAIRSYYDFEKATLIGANTFGKGIMQNTYELSDGSSIIFTVATYKTSKTPNFDGVITSYSIHYTKLYDNL